MPGTRRPAYHLTPPAHWMNDPQRPLFREGQWHLYYLYNADFPHGNGTAWARAVSADMVIWRTAGVAIPKYVDEWGDVESGSVVVDEQGAAGLGAGAVVAFATQQADGVQRQSLFVSHDDGQTFVPAPGNPVLDNPGTTDFRDPKVIFDARGERWVMVLAEGPRLGFYASTDLREWDVPLRLHVQRPRPAGVSGPVRDVSRRRSRQTGLGAAGVRERSRTGSLDRHGLLDRDLGRRRLRPRRAPAPMAGRRA